MQTRTLSMAQVLMYDPEVPLSARVALRRACITTSPAMREAWLEVAATNLVHEAELDRADALALVGLDDDVEGTPVNWEDLAVGRQTETMVESRCP